MLKNLWLCFEKINSVFSLCDVPKMVVPQMAGLTPCPQAFVLYVVVFAVVVKVGNRKDYPRPVSFCAVVFNLALFASRLLNYPPAVIAPLSGPLQDARHYFRFPVRRIFRVVARHNQFALWYSLIKFSIRFFRSIRQCRSTANAPQKAPRKKQSGQISKSQRAFIRQDFSNSIIISVRRSFILHFTCTGTNSAITSGESSASTPAFCRASPMCLKLEQALSQSIRWEAYRM